MTTGIHLYACCLNEARMLPYFLRHYRNLIDRFVVYDNGSTDESLHILGGDERIEVRPFVTDGDSFGAVYKLIMDNCWKESRGTADWVITAEVDEHLYHVDMIGYLDHCRATGVTAVTPIGYDMCTRSFPTGKNLLLDQVQRGRRADDFDKLAIFNPNALQEIDYMVGRHAAHPVGDVIGEDERQVLLLHFKAMGADYICSRNETLRRGLKPDDIAQGIGKHYLRSRQEVESELEHALYSAHRVPGLPHHAPLDPRDVTIDDEFLLITQSGLFDQEQYLQRYPDVAAGEQSPLVHFCTYGWHEDRWPNAYFHTGWYRRLHESSLPPDVNPLLDYIMVGERAGRCPSPIFNPELHRSHYRLAPGTPALRHLLATRAARISAEQAEDQP